MDSVTGVIDWLQGLLDGIEKTWSSFSKGIGDLLNIQGPIEEIIGGIIIASVLGVIGFVVYQFVGN